MRVFRGRSAGELVLLLELVITGAMLLASMVFGHWPFYYLFRVLLGGFWITVGAGLATRQPWTRVFNKQEWGPEWGVAIILLGLAVVGFGVVSLFGGHT